MIALALACSGLLLGDLPPSSPRSAALQGLIYDQGQWVAPESVAAQDLADRRYTSLQAEYAARRSKAPGTAEGQRSLAQWCDRVGLEAEAVAHYTAVTRLEPDDPEARRRLGYRRHQGRWMTGSEIAAEIAEDDAQVKADREWGAKIATWRRWLTEPEHRAEAIRGLAGIRDPRAIPALRRSFGHPVGWEQAWAIQVLGRLDAPASSRELAELAVFGVDEPTRRAAIKKLLPRDPRTFVGLMINWLRDPIRYEVVSPRGPGSVGLLRVEGEAAIVERTYTVATPTGASPRSVDGEARRAVADRQRDDTRTIDQANVTIELTNERVERALQAVTGQDLGPNREPWASWWTNEIGYSYQSPESVSKPVVTEDVQVTYIPRPVPVVTSPHSCFAAGTSVLARSGPRAIEDLRVGDQVLSQDPATGELAFRPILAIFHNKPAPTLRVHLEAETIVATPIHRFWRAAEGWTMARDLRPGDRIRTVGGIAEVLAVGRDQVQPVFNLEVAGGHSFFVGQSRALVHDNTLVAPTPAPFDAGVAVAGASNR